MSNPITPEQIRTLKPGTLLLCIENCGMNGPQRHAVVIYERENPEYRGYLQILFGSNFSITCTASGGWIASNFEVWNPHVAVAVMRLDAVKNTLLQEASFRAGYRWNNVGAALFYTTSDSLVFSLDKRITHSASRDRDAGYVYLNADNPAQFAAALQFFEASIGPRSIEHILTADVLAMVRSNPENPMVRGLIRAACNKAVPKETIAAGSDAIIKWLLEEFNPKPPEPPESLPPPPPGANVDAPPSVEQMAATVNAINQELAQMATAPPPPAIAIDPGVPAPPPPPPRTRRVRYNFTDIGLGTCNCARTRHREGEIEVPEDIVAGGSDAVEEWIRENRTDPGRVGSIEYSDHDWDDWSEGEIHSDAAQVCDAFDEEMNANMAEDLPVDFYDDNGEAYHH